MTEVNLVNMITKRKRSLEIRNTGVLSYFCVTMRYVGFQTFCQTDFGRFAPVSDVLPGSKLQIFKKNTNQVFRTGFPVHDIVHESMNKAQHTETNFWTFFDGL